MGEFRATNKHVFSTGFKGVDCIDFLSQQIWKLKNSVQQRAQCQCQFWTGLATTLNLYGTEEAKEPDHTEVMVIKGASTLP